MILQKVDPNRACFSEYTLEGAILTIGGIPVDLAAEQEEQEQVLTFCSCNGMIHRGMMPCCKYVAEVIIPPRRYELVEVADERDEADEGPGTHTETVPLLLDLDSVILNVWPVEDNPDQETRAAGGEDAE